MKIELKWEDAKEMIEYGFKCYKEAINSKSGTSHGHKAEYWDGFIEACSAFCFAHYNKEFRQYFLKRMLGK